MDTKILKYIESHEYIYEEDGIATIGITEYAVEQLGDIVFVELPDIGTEFEKGDEIGSIESVKTVSELYSPISGKVMEINQVLGDEPELINTDCYGNGWIIRLDITKPEELEETMNFEQYEKFLDTL